MSIPMEELKAYKWPKPNFPIGQEVLDRTTPDDPRGIPDDNLVSLIPRSEYTYSGKTWPRDYMSSCFIPQERIACIPLAGIPNGSSRIQGLLADGDTLYGITGGENAYGFTFRKERVTAHFLAGGISAAAIIKGNETPFILLENGRIITLDSKEIFTLPAAVSCATGNGDRFGGILADGRLFLVKPSERTLLLETCPDKDLSPAVALGKTGLYGASADGFLFHWDGERFRKLNCRMPSFAGRRVYNRVGALLLTEDETSLWGGTSEDGILFECILKDGEVRCYGKPLAGRGIFAMTLSAGTLYGLGGAGCCHIFRRDMRTAELTDEGLLNVSSPRSWCLYEANTLIPDGNGGIWVGEADRISHLFHVSFCD